MEQVQAQSTLQLVEALTNKLATVVARAKAISPRDFNTAQAELAHDSIQNTLEYILKDMTLLVRTIEWDKPSLTEGRSLLECRRGVNVVTPVADARFKHGDVVYVWTRRIGSRSQAYQRFIVQTTWGLITSYDWATDKHRLKIAKSFLVGRSASSDDTWLLGPVSEPDARPSGLPEVLPGYLIGQVLNIGGDSYQIDERHGRITGPDLICRLIVDETMGMADDDPTALTDEDTPDFSNGTAGDVLVEQLGEEVAK